MKGDEQVEIREDISLALAEETTSNVSNVPSSFELGCGLKLVAQTEVNIQQCPQYPNEMVTSNKASLTKPLGLSNILLDRYEGQTKVSGSTEHTSLNICEKSWDGYHESIMARSFFSASSLPAGHSTVVEQPSLLISSCFICGRNLIDPSERFNFLSTQKLFCMKMDLLSFLGEVIGKKVTTNTNAIEMCGRCSDLVNEADRTLNHMCELKQELRGFFENNKRPKLSYQMVPKTANTCPTKKHSLLESSLAELASTRPRSGKRRKILENKDIQIKKKTLGRPKKPFQCHVCKRKFPTEITLAKHTLKEHNTEVILPVLCNKKAPTTTMNVISLSPSSGLNLKTSNIEPTTPKIPYRTIKEEPRDNRMALGTSDVVNEFPSLPMNALPDKKSMPLGMSYIKPIQPKPQTVVQNNSDGSVTFFMESNTGSSASALIKVSPGYLDLKKNCFVCEYCTKKFFDKRSFMTHQAVAHISLNRKHHTEHTSDPKLKLFECFYCETIFSTRKLLNEHKKVSHPDDSNHLKKTKAHKCDECEKVFNFKYELESHKETHLPFNQVGPHEFVCCLCGLKVASKAALKKHIHHFHSSDGDTKDLLCAECGYMTNSKKTFTDHLRTHNECTDKKTQCDLCAKEMRTSSYKSHMLRMHGEAKHPCDICEQKFTVRSDLMKHLNSVHSNMKPYSCVVCNERFPSSEALRYHKNTVHSVVIHVCNVCGKGYKWKGELGSHMSRCHADHTTKFCCALCSRTYTERRKLKLHMLEKHHTDLHSANIKSVEPIIRSTETIDASGVNTSYDTNRLAICDLENNQPTVSHETQLVTTSSLTNLGIYQNSDNPPMVLTSLHEEFHSHMIPHPDSNIITTGQEQVANLQSIYLVPDLNMSVTIHQNDP